MSVLGGNCPNLVENKALLVDISAAGCSVSGVSATSGFLTMSIFSGASMTEELAKLKGDTLATLPKVAVARNRIKAQKRSFNDLLSK